MVERSTYAQEVRLAYKVYVQSIFLVDAILGLGMKVYVDQLPVVGINKPLNIYKYLTSIEKCGLLNSNHVSPELTFGSYDRRNLGGT